MFVFDGLSGVSRTVKLRYRQPNCLVCGENPSILSLIDYQHFCGSCTPGDERVSLDAEDRVSCQEYHSVVQSGKKHLLIDVRPKTEFAICHLENAISILRLTKIVLLALIEQKMRTPLPRLHKLNGPRPHKLNGTLSRSLLSLHGSQTFL